MNNNQISCSVCGSKLENPKSLIAGIGPVCFEKVTFTEILNSKELETLEKKREKWTDEKKGQLLLFNDTNRTKIGITLSVDNDNIYLLNRKLVKKNHSDLTNSYLDAIEKIKKENISYVSSIGKSSSPDIRRAFNYFKRKLSKEIESISFLEKDYDDKGLNTFSFNSIEKKEKMTTSQIVNRESFLRIKDLNPEIYSFYWKNGIYQRSTLIYRLKNLEYKEGKEFYNFLISKENNQFLELQTKDYGLTNEEIYNGLRNSNQKLEANLFKSFVSGNPNFNLMLLIAKNYKKLNKTNKIVVYKFFIKISNTHKKYNKEDLKNLFT